MYIYINIFFTLCVFISGTNKWRTTLRVKLQGWQQITVPLSKRGVNQMQRGNNCYIAQTQRKRKNMLYNLLNVLRLKYKEELILYHNRKGCCTVVIAQEHFSNQTTVLHWDFTYILYFTCILLFVGGAEASLQVPARLQIKPWAAYIACGIGQTLTSHTASLNPNA